VGARAEAKTESVPQVKTNLRGDEESPQDPDICRLRAVYRQADGVWAADLVEPTIIPECRPGELMLVCDPSLPWSVIIGTVTRLAADLSGDQIELESFPEAA
jgi:hypothetical protein